MLVEQKEFESQVFFFPESQLPITRDDLSIAAPGNRPMLRGNDIDEPSDLYCIQISPHFICLRAQTGNSPLVLCYSVYEVNDLA
jgi:hypothetical protein